MLQRHKQIKLPPDNIADWFKMPFPTKLQAAATISDFSYWRMHETEGRMYNTHSHIYFENEADAVMYALRWM